MTTEKSKLKNRGWVKNAIIIFLVIMLILTFFSNTILNYSLPEVSGRYSGYGSILTSVRGTGTVQANEEYSITAKETRKIKSVLVRSGDYVEIGQVLFLLDEADSAELQAAQEELEALQLAYSRALLQYTPADYSISDLQLKYAKEDYQALLDERDAMVVFEAELKDAQANTKAAKAALLSAQKKTAGLEEDISLLSSFSDYDDVRDLLTADMLKKLELIERAERNVEQCQQEYDDALEELKDLTPDNGEYEMIIAKVNDAQKAFETAKKTFDRHTEDYEMLKSVCDGYAAALNAQKTAAAAYEAALAAADGNEGAAEVVSAKAALDASDAECSSAQAAYSDEVDSYLIDIYNDANASYKSAVAIYGADSAEAIGAKAKLDTAESDLNSPEKRSDPGTLSSFLLEIKRGLEDEQDEVLDLESDYKVARSELSEISSESGEYNHAKKLLDNAEADLEDAKAELETLNKEFNKALTALIKSLKAELADANNAQEAAQEAYEDAQKLEDEAASKVTSTVESLDAQIKNAERSLEETYIQMEQERKSDEKSDALTQMDFAEQKKAIDKQAEAVAKLRGEAGGDEITAPYSGTITSVPVIAGETPGAGSTVATMELSEKGYTLSFTVTAAQAQRLHIGDSANVTGGYWGSSVYAELESIKNQPGTSEKLATFSVSGDASVGQSLTLSVGERSMYYDCVIPKSALREDANGSFVLAAIAKNTPLGNRYTATRYDVDVLAEDDVNAAISVPDISYFYEFIITTSTKPVSAGTQVRLSET